MTILSKISNSELEATIKLIIAIQEEPVTIKIVMAELIEYFDGRFETEFARDIIERELK